MSDKVKDTEQQVTVSDTDKQEPVKETEKQDSEELKIPDVLPLLPVRDVVVYPFMIIPLFVGRDMSVKAVDSAWRETA